MRALCTRPAASQYHTKSSKTVEPKVSTGGRISDTVTRGIRYLVGRGNENLMPEVVSRPVVLPGDWHCSSVGREASLATLVKMHIEVDETDHAR